MRHTQQRIDLLGRIRNLHLLGGADGSLIEQEGGARPGIDVGQANAIARLCPGGQIHVQHLAADAHQMTSVDQIVDDLAFVLLASLKRRWLCFVALQQRRALILDPGQQQFWQGGEIHDGPLSARCNAMINSASPREMPRLATSSIAGAPSRAMRWASA